MRQIMLSRSPLQAAVPCRIMGAARQGTDVNTGIVLEGGAVRTIFSTGVCDAQLTRDLLPDYVIGVSAGIAYGVSYVS